MKSLLYKEYKTLEWYAWAFFYIPPLIIAGLGFLGKYSSLLGLMAFVLPAELSCSVSIADFKEKWDKYSEVLPISREKTINEKFLLILANSLYSLFFVEAGLIIGNLMRGEPVFDLNNAVALITFFAALALCGFGMLMMFLVNYAVSLFIMGFSGGFLGGFSSIISSTGNLFEFDEAYKSGLLRNPNFYIAVAVVCGLIFVISWIVTFMVYRRKNI